MLLIVPFIGTEIDVPEEMVEDYKKRGFIAKAKKQEQPKPKQDQRKARKRV